MIVYLKNQSGVLTEAILSTDITYGQVEAADREWTSIKRSVKLPILASANVPQSHEWNWGKKFLEQAHDHRFYGVECEGKLQGLMQITRTPHSSRRPGHEQARTLYVDYLETAPWNQNIYSSDGIGRYRRVGYNLIVAATAESGAAGCDERLSLHSLEDAEPFYREFPAENGRLFVDLGLGFEPDPGLRYFESRSLAERTGRE